MQFKSCGVFSFWQQSACYYAPCCTVFNTELCQKLSIRWIITAKESSAGEAGAALGERRSGRKDLSKCLSASALEQHSATWKPAPLTLPAPLGFVTGVSISSNSKKSILLTDTSVPKQEQCWKIPQAQQVSEDTSLLPVLPLLSCSWDEWSLVCKHSPCTSHLWKFQPHSPHPTQQQTKCSQLRLFLSPPHP